MVTAKVTESSNCSGCGISLQTNDKESAGYIDKARFRKIAETKNQKQAPVEIVTADEQEKLLF